MKNKVFFLTLTATVFMSSCATIFTGTKDSINFDSTPQGAAVYIDGLEVCKTPCVTEVKRSINDKMAKIRLDGYETRVITLDREFNPISAINLANLLGWGIDVATGSVMRYGKKGYELELKKLEKENKTSSLSHPIKIEIDTKKQLVDIYVAQK